MTPLDRLTLLQSVPVEAPEGVLLALVVAFALGMVVSLTHRFSVPHRRVAASMQASLALLPVVAAMVLLVIGDSLARAFSLVGALAIVRFRTRLRTTWDITFVFLSLAAGIGCGVGKLPIAVAGVAVAVAAVQVLGLLPGTRPAPEPLTLRCDLSAWDCGPETLAPLLAEACTSATLASTRSLRFGETLSLIYRVHLREGRAMPALVRDLSRVEGVERVEALTSEAALRDSDG